jgi:hypothetical protein
VSLKLYNEKINTIEKEIKGKKISDYEIFLIDGKSYESIFLRDKVEIHVFQSQKVI